jgi:hypothetical protein
VVPRLQGRCHHIFAFGFLYNFLIVVRGAYEEILFADFYSMAKFLTKTISWHIDLQGTVFVLRLLLMPC